MRHSPLLLVVAVLAISIGGFMLLSTHTPYSLSKLDEAADLHTSELSSSITNDSVGAVTVKPVHRYVLKPGQLKIDCIPYPGLLVVENCTYTSRHVLVSVKLRGGRYIACRIETALLRCGSAIVKIFVPAVEIVCDSEKCLCIPHYSAGIWHMLRRPCLVITLRR